MCRLINRFDLCFFYFFCILLILSLLKLLCSFTIKFALFALSLIT